MTTIHDCINAVARKYDVRPDAIIGRRYGARLIEARMLAYWLARNATGKAWTQIARQFDGRDPKTVSQGVNRIDDRRRRDTKFAQSTDMLLSRLKSEAPRAGPDRKLRVERTRLMFLAGMSDKEIARALRVARSTVQTYRKEVRAYHDPVNKAKAEAKTPSLTSLKCLGCGSQFLSEDRRANRMCNRCKNTRAWRDGGDYSVDGRL